jgi:hypothetical protein
MSVAYALKHPERVHKLVLVSPVGVPESPYQDHPQEHLHDAPEPVEAMAESELAQDQAVTAKAHRDGQPRPQQPSPDAAKPTMKRTWWSVLWEQNVCCPQVFLCLTVSIVTDPLFPSPGKLEDLTIFGSSLSDGLWTAPRYKVCPEEVRHLRNCDAKRSIRLPLLGQFLISGTTENGTGTNCCCCFVRYGQNEVQENMVSN